MNVCKVLVTTALAVTLQLTLVAGTNYTVGAPGGFWDLSTDYAKWASNITFHPSDNLSKSDIFGIFLSTFQL
jgi:hypothetical protein